MSLYLVCCVSFADDRRTLVAPDSLRSRSLPQRRRLESSRRLDASLCQGRGRATFQTTDRVIRHKLSNHMGQEYTRHYVCCRMLEEHVEQLSKEIAAHNATLDQAAAQWQKATDPGIRRILKHMYTTTWNRRERLEAQRQKLEELMRCKGDTSHSH